MNRNPIYKWKILGVASVKVHEMEVRTRKKTFRLAADTWQNQLEKIKEIEDISDANFDNFRRSDQKSRAYIVTTLLAFYDAGIRKTGYSNVAILDCGREGCHHENLLYFHDYLENGRLLGRGHLFVGTLPSTPLSEAAISLRLNGPAYYIDTLGEYDIAYSEIESLLEDREIEQALFFHFEKNTVYCFCIGRGEIEIPDGTTPRELYLRETNSP